MPKRIMVVGCPGSGKSTFSRRLEEIYGLPLIHIDMLFHKPDRTVIDKDILDEKIKDVVAGDEWIVDGNYSSSYDIRLSRAEVVFFLDYSQEVCIRGVKARIGEKRPDMPWIEEELDPEFLDYVIGFHETKRPILVETLRKYEHSVEIVVFQNRAEAENYLRNLDDGLK